VNPPAEISVNAIQKCYRLSKAAATYLDIWRFRNLKLNIERIYMMTSKIITSRNNDNKILKFYSEIKLLNNQIRRAEETGRWRDNLQPDQVANLRSQLKQKEFEKLELEFLISSGLTAALAPVNGKAQTYTISAYGLSDLAHECEELLIARGINSSSHS